MRVTWLAIALLLIAAPAWATGQFYVAWTCGDEPDIAGFKIYYGYNSGMYTEFAYVENPALREYTLTGVREGVYKVAMTAYDTLGNESGFSNEVTKTAGPSGPWAFQLSNLRFER